MMPQRRKLCRAILARLRYKVSATFDTRRQQVRIRDLSYWLVPNTSIVEGEGEWRGATNDTPNI